MCCSCDRASNFGATSCAPQVRFVLMNSFSTSEDTKAFLNKNHGDLLSESNVELVQNKSPKVDAKTLLPVEYSQDPDLEWWVLRALSPVAPVAASWTAAQCSGRTSRSSAQKTAEAVALQLWEPTGHPTRMLLVLHRGAGGCSCAQPCAQVQVSARARRHLPGPAGLQIFGRPAEGGHQVPVCVQLGQPGRHAGLGPARLFRRQQQVLPHGGGLRWRSWSLCLAHKPHGRSRCTTGL